jgi:DNA-binding LacI/PurR family transcriptional regulator
VVNKGSRADVGVSLAVIARNAGVSEATVSRVLNRRNGVAARTRELVEEALREYSVRSRPTLTLILVPGLTNPFFATLADRIHNELELNGMRALVCPVSAGSSQEREYVESMVDAELAAVVFLSASNTLRHSDPSARRLLQARGVPFVGVNGGFDDAAAPVFSTDDRRAAELAVDHLADLGHRRIAMCAGPTGNLPSERRIEGFLAACRVRGLDEEATPVFHQYYTVEAGALAAARALDHGVTAIVAASDDMALGAIQAVRARGLRVPDDVSVVGYDDSAVLDHTDPPLTSIRQPVDRLAEHTSMAVVALATGHAVEGIELMLEPEIRVRASTAPPPSEARATSAGPAIVPADQEGATP